MVFFQRTCQHELFVVITAVIDNILVDLLSYRRSSSPLKKKIKRTLRKFGIEKNTEQDFWCIFDQKEALVRLTL